MKLNNLNDLYVDTLKDLYSAEQQIISALPKMVKAASSPDLKRGLQDHLDQTRRQVDRLSQIFTELGTSPTGKKCKGMEGLIEEGEEILESNANPDVLDAGLIASAQKVEHYEISGYGTARTFARQLGFTNAAQVLQQILQEEKTTDEKLTALAESGINIQAKKQ
jgi:ferritin-like metal-binding protein YciE